MNTTLTLRRAIWNTSTRRSIMNTALSQSANELEGKIKGNIDRSTPAGRLYARGRLTARKSLSSVGKSARKTSTRVYIGAQIFRASAPGQPPAKRTNKLYESINVRRVPAKLQILAEVNAPGASVLDNPGKLNRPFFRTQVQDFRQHEFRQTIKEAIRSLLV